MRRPNSVQGLEALGRVRLSPHFFMRDFLHSEIANFHGLPNIPDDPTLAIAAGERLCETLLEPLHASFGGLTIRSAYRAPAVNEYGNRMGYNCATNAKSHAGHIWDRLDGEGYMGATACVVVPWYLDRYALTGDWRPLAWWIHDHLAYGHLQFFPKLAAFNIQWHERPKRLIDSYAPPKGILTRPGMANHGGHHRAFYPGFPPLRPAT